MKNPDRDKRHSRRRKAGTHKESPDGQKVAEALYGGDPSVLEEEEETEDEPTLFTDGNNDG